MIAQEVEYKPVSSMSGWVLFSGTITMISAAANLLYGLILLLNDDWVAVTTDGLIRFNTSTAGIIFLVFAGFQLIVSFGIFNGDLWARIFGIAGASIGILAQMAYLSIYPAWSWLVILVDMLIVYGLAIHGDEVSEL